MQARPNRGQQGEGGGSFGGMSRESHAVACAESGTWPDFEGVPLTTILKNVLTGVLNAGYGEQLTVLDLARRILQITHSSSRIQFEPARIGDVRYSQAGIERLREAGFRPEGTMDAGLHQMFRTFQSSSAPSPILS